MFIPCLKRVLTSLSVFALIWPQIPVSKKKKTKFRWCRKYAPGFESNPRIIFKYLCSGSIVRNELRPLAVAELSSFECIEFRVYLVFLSSHRIVSKEGTKITIMSLVFCCSLLCKELSGSAEGRLCDWRVATKNFDH